MEMGMRGKGALLFAGTVLAAMMGCGAPVAKAEDGITDLGTLNGGLSSAAEGMSADSAAVVGWSFSENGQRAFRWTAETGMVSLGTLNGGAWSSALGVSADGDIVVGSSKDGAAGDAFRAFRWTADTGMVSLGTLNDGTSSSALGASADGGVVVGFSEDGARGNAFRAFRWMADTGMASLGTLNGGSSSIARKASSGGGVVVGFSEDGATGNASRAFRWTADTGMLSLGTLNGGSGSDALGVSADGDVVVGNANDGAAGNASRAFRWTAETAMVSLGTLNGGTSSSALGVSADGGVVVGSSKDGAAKDAFRAFRWTADTGMQSVEDWLRTAGIAVPAGTAAVAQATNADGSVVVGQLTNSHAFIARVDPTGSGIVTLADVQDSLAATAEGGTIALRAAATAVNGAHSRPLARRVAPGKTAAWVAGDLGRDDHGSRDGRIGLGEAGLGRNFGPVQLNLSVGRLWSSQTLLLDGRAAADGTYVLAEALARLADAGDGAVWGVLTGYGHWGDAEIRRGYLNAGAPDASRGKADTRGWGVRGRVQWENALTAVGAGLSPYADVSHARTRLAGYTETGGGFPARLEARSETATEARLGVDAVRPLADGAIRLLGAAEWAHRFEKDGARTAGQVIGLFPFDIPGDRRKRDWLRGMVGAEADVGPGVFSLAVNATTEGDAPNLWLATAYRMAF